MRAFNFVNFTVALAAMMGASPAVSQDALPSFKVQALIMKADSTTQPLANRKQIKITRSGQQDTQDIVCDDETDGEGYVYCEVVKCNPASRISKIYYIHFASPFTISENGPAKIRISQCKVMPPEPYLAYYAPKNLMAAYLAQDIQYLIGDVTFASLKSDEAKNEFSHEYALKLGKVMGGPLGDKRISNVRKYLQDTSAMALKQGDKVKSVEYHDLQYVHGNAMAVALGNEIGIKIVTMDKAWTNPQLTKNLGKVDNYFVTNREELVTDEDINKFASVQVDVNELKAAVQKGRLNTHQFNKLEALGSVGKF